MCAHSHRDDQGAPGDRDWAARHPHQVHSPRGLRDANHQQGEDQDYALACDTQALGLHAHGVCVCVCVHVCVASSLCLPLLISSSSWICRFAGLELHVVLCIIGCAFCFMIYLLLRVLLRATHFASCCALTAHCHYMSCYALRLVLRTLLCAPHSDFTLDPRTFPT